MAPDYSRLNTAVRSLVRCFACERPGLGRSHPAAAAAAWSVEALPTSGLFTS